MTFSVYGRNAPAFSEDFHGNSFPFRCINFAMMQTLALQMQKPPDRINNGRG